MSAQAGELYDSYVPGKYNREQMAEALSGIWDPILKIDLAMEVKAALAGKLPRSGV